MLYEREFTQRLAILAAGLEKQGEVHCYLKRVFNQIASIGDQQNNTLTQTQLSMVS